MIPIFDYSTPPDCRLLPTFSAMAESIVPLYSKVESEYVKVEMVDEEDKTYCS